MSNVNYAEKIAKCEEFIAKKNNLITKRRKQIDKAVERLNPHLKAIGVGKVVFYNEDEAKRIRNSLDAYCGNRGYYEVAHASEIYDIICDLHTYLESIDNCKSAIADKEKTVLTYRQRLAKEEDKDTLINQMPSVFREFRNDLIVKWDAFDIEHRPIIERINGRVRNAEYRLHRQKRYVREERFCHTEEELATSRANRKWNAIYNRLERMLEYRYKPYSHLEYLIGLSDEKIHELNVESTRNLILDLYERVIKITGAITDASGLHVTRGNDGFAVINGIVYGESGVARVESHGCAGYNIVRYYVRTNVYPVH